MLNNNKNIFEVGNFNSNNNIETFTKNKNLTEPVRLIDVSQSSCWAITEDNKVWYKGCSEDYNFPNNENSYSSFKELKPTDNWDMKEQLE